MMMLRMFVSFFVLLLTSSSLLAQPHREVAITKDTTIVKNDKRQTTAIRGVQYTSPDEAAAALAAQKRLPFLAGVSVSADVCGMVMAACTPYGQYEAAARLNLRGRYFPIVELGIGTSNHTNETSNLHYKVHSPYYRVGMDYNVARNASSMT